MEIISLGGKNIKGIETKKNEKIMPKTKLKTGHVYSMQGAKDACSNINTH